MHNANKSSQWPNIPFETYLRASGCLFHYGDFFCWEGGGGAAAAAVGEGIPGPSLEGSPVGER